MASVAYHTHQVIIIPLYLGIEHSTHICFRSCYIYINAPESLCPPNLNLHPIYIGWCTENVKITLCIRHIWSQSRSRSSIVITFNTANNQYKYYSLWASVFHRVREVRGVYGNWWLTEHFKWKDGSFTSEKALQKWTECSRAILDLIAVSNSIAIVKAESATRRFDVAICVAANAARRERDSSLLAKLIQCQFWKHWNKRDTVGNVGMSKTREQATQACQQDTPGKEADRSKDSGEHLSFAYQTKTIIEWAKHVGDR